MKKLNAIEHPEWTIEQSKDLYGFERWGNDYFSVSANGNVTARTKQKSLLIVL